MILRRSFFIVPLLSVFSACGWNRSLEFALAGSPERIEIFQPYFDPMLGLRVDLVNSKHRIRLLEAGETYIGFAHAYRSPSGIVALLVCGTRPVHIAYDLDLEKMVAYETVREALDHDAEVRYGRDPNGSEPSRCLGTYYQDQFRKRFPELLH